MNGNSTSIGGSPTATGGSAPYTYLWFDLNGVANPAATANPSVSPATSTSYIVYVIDTNNCAGSDQVNVTVTNPFASCERPSNISVNNNSANSVTLNWNTVPGADMYQLQYRAQTGDRTVNTAVTANTSKTLNDLTENVIYQYRLKANCDAGAVSAWKFGSFTTHVFRMGESGIFDDVSFYPNPVSDKLNIAITTTSPIVEKLNIEMFNVLGQKVEDMTGQISGGFNYQVDVNKQPAGQYLVKVSIGDRVFNETIIIE